MLIHTVYGFNSYYSFQIFTQFLLVLILRWLWSVWLYVLCPMSESPGRKREGLQDNAIGKKGEVYYWLKPGPSATSSAVVQVREPRAQAVTQIYRVSTRRWFKLIGYKFAKQFHWSKLLRGRDFPGGFHPFPNFLIGKQLSVLSES